MINWTDITTYHFVTELDQIQYTTNDDVTFSIKDSNNVTVLSSTYTPVDGKVTICHLYKLLMPLVPGVMATFTLTMGSSSKTVKVVHSRERVDEGAMTFLPSFFLSAVMTERDTALGRREAVTLLPFESTDVSATCLYIDSDGTMTTETKSVATSLAADTVHTLDVSPSAFVDDDAGELIGYTVTAGSRSMKFRVTTLKTADVAMLVQNTFGAWEPFYFEGMTEYNADFTRENAYINGQLKNYNVDMVRTYKSYTGPLRPAGVILAMDLAACEDLYLLENNVTGDAIVVTAVDVKHTSEDDDIRDFTITWQHASMVGASTTVVRPPELFDDTFDDTYE